MILKHKKFTDIEDMEIIDVVLNEEELNLLHSVFNELNDFEQITDCLEMAVSNNKINHTQLNQLYKIFTKTIYFKVSLNRNTKPKKGIIKTFFELPEIISKRFYSYFYHNRYTT